MNIDLSADMNINLAAEFIANKIMISVQSNKYHTNTYNTDRNDFNYSHLKKAAKEGIELGLFQQYVKYEKK